MSFAPTCVHVIMTYPSIHHSYVHAASGASVGTFTDTSNKYPCYEGTTTSFIHFGPFLTISPPALSPARAVESAHAHWCLQSCRIRQSECYAQFTSSGGENCCQFCLTFKVCKTVERQQGQLGQVQDRVGA